MTTVTGKLIGATDPQRVEMRATLVDVTGKDAVGYVSSVPGELVKPMPITADSDGDWTVDLTANSLITSDSGDTLWAIQEGRAKDGTPILTYVVVPEADGPYWAGGIRADLSVTMTSSGTVVYLPGPEGDPGPAGADGAPGAPGASAYQVAVAEGFAGTEEEWLATLVGPQGDPGPQGPQPELGAAGAGADIALRSTDPTTTNSRTPTVHAASHATGGSDPLTPAAIDAEPAGTTTAAMTTHTSADDPHAYKTWADAKFALGSTVTAIDGYLNDALGRVSAIEQGTAWLSGLNIDGNAQVANGNLTVSGNLTVTGNALGQATPATHGVASWCYDPALAVNSTSMSNGTPYLTRLDIAASVNVTKIYWWVGNSGSSPVSGQNQVGLYDASGVLLASANVDAAVSSAALKTTTIPAQALTAGSFYWVAMVFNASVAPTLTRASGWTGVATAANLGLVAATYRFATNGTGRTSLPSSITPASNVGTDFAGPWAALGA
ncbi:collagen-like triple helix repeat-containing protein [Streptomyces violaceus]|uniref:Collagen-like protein n=1 Tax=Streptomyces violaceus TaxID=1936 RepID=A0ABY9UMK3_STRVL|nr:collagen-like protein [Streptomyces janthinus]WND24129.1 collagen-like protein [Streptomyces janthinus]GGS96998.1 hypothetical protein GCM10010270_81280 [Streptomyces janthinus]